MRRVLLSIVLVLAFPTLSNAAPCTTTSLAAYVNLGAGGCTVGAYTVFDVLATALLPPEVADPIDPATVTVTPVEGVALDFGVDAFTDDQQLDLLIRFSLTGPPLGSTRLSLSNSDASRDASVSAIQDACVGGTFQAADPTSPCSGTPSTVIVLQTAADLVSPVSDTFRVNSFFDVFIEITADPGLLGAATAGTVSTRFGSVSVPEPSIVVLVALSLAAVHRRRLRV